MALAVSSADHPAATASSIRSRMPGTPVSAIAGRRLLALSCQSALLARLDLQSVVQPLPDNQCRGLDNRPVVSVPAGRPPVFKGGSALISVVQPVLLRLPVYVRGKTRVGRTWFYIQMIPMPCSLRHRTNAQTAFPAWKLDRYHRRIRSC